MASYRAVCPGCGGKFPWNPILGLPKLCPLPGCDYRMASDRPDDDIVMPSIAKARQAIDGVYRAMEEGSIHRMQVAKEMGVEGAETLKITNMRDNVRPGEISAMPLPANPVSERMAQMERQGLPVGFGANGLGLSGAVAEGPLPNAGARLQQMIRSTHRERIDPRHAGAVASDMPSLEVQNPLYRKRV